jgi:uncharacterized protein YegP (UPF0339 family)
MWYGWRALSEPLALLASRATSPVRRAERRLAVATANKKSRASKRPARPPAHIHGPAAMEFLIFEDNSGSYRWTILADDGTTLGHSGDFVSYDDAEQAAQQIRDGAASARLEPRENGTLHEGGRFSREAVAQ